MSSALKHSRKRPVLISLLCVVRYIISAGQIVVITDPANKTIGWWYPLVYGVITAFRFIAIVGVWNMKRWGVELFFYFSVIKIIVQVLVGDTTTFANVENILAIIFSLLFLLYYKKMDRNL